MVELQLVSIPKATDPQPLELLIGRTATLKVEAPTNDLSKTYKVPRMKDWVLGQPMGDPEGEPVFQPLGSAPALSGNKQLIIVLRKSLEDGAGLVLVPVDNIALGGTFMFFDASDYGISGRVDQSHFSIEPEGHVTVKPGPSEVSSGRKSCHVHLNYAYGGKDRPFYSSTWRLNDKARSLVFFYQDPVSRKLRLHVIRCYLP